MIWSKEKNIEKRAYKRFYLSWVAQKNNSNRIRIFTKVAKPIV